MKSQPVNYMLITFSSSVEMWKSRYLRGKDINRALPEVIGKVEQRLPIIHETLPPPWPSPKADKVTWVFIAPSGCQVDSVSCGWLESTFTSVLAAAVAPVAHLQHN